MNQVVNYTKTIPVRYQTDVCVIGGGPAGVAAAVTAARQGAKVFLIESQGFFGGAATGALVPAFMTFDNGVDFLAGGIGKEIYDACTVDPVVIVKEKDYVGIDVELLKRTYDDMVAEAGVEYLFFTSLIDVITVDGRIDTVILSAKSGIYALKAKVFIDATGDGDLCAMAGAPFEQGDQDGKTMPSTLCSMWVNIDWDTVPFEHRDKLEDAFADGVFTQEDRHVSGIFRTGKTTGGGNLGHAFNMNGVDERDLTRAMVDGRKIITEFKTYFNNYVGGGYSKAFPVISGSTLGVRETRRILGDYVLCEADYRDRACFDDEIGRYAYPLDVHPSGGDKEAYAEFLKLIEAYAYKPGESYGIPYRSLLPQKLENTFVAGRCISTDQRMQSSVRVMPGCFITGQAVGAAAAQCVKENRTTRQVDVKALQQTLLKMGAYLPNA